MYTIYALVDPIEDYKVCYVGMSSDITERYIQHLRCTDKNPAKNEWVKGLREKGYVPTIRTLEVVETEAEAFSREAYWIHFYKGLHMPLTNTHIPPISMRQKEYSFSNALRVPGARGDTVQRFIGAELKKGRTPTLHEIMTATGCSKASASRNRSKVLKEQENAS